MRFVILVLTSVVSILVGSQGAVAAVVPDSSSTVTIVLSPPDRAGLRALAAATGISHRDRMARLAALQPTAEDRAKVIDSVTRLGYEVTATSAWTVTAKAPSVQVSAQFGAARKARSAVAPATSLPFYPAELNGLVSAVFPDTATGVHHHMTLPYGPSGADLRTAYSAPAGNAPSGKGGQTIATLQFSGWDPSDLTNYAAAVGLPDPVASGQYVGIGVGRETARLARDGDGDGEVALDQQALLSVAPHLRQRAYYATNSLSGELAALHQIATDASDASHNFYGLVALSISWGICESAYLLPNGSVDTNSLNAELDAYTNIVAAGVTVFASSGDAGAYDCAVPGTTDLAAATTPAVDTPGSFPQVISVGGTTLSPADPTTGAAYVENVWADKAAPQQGPYRGDGGGGGRSVLVSRPAYQSTLTIPGQDRLVPDIAALAAPGDGIAVYWARLGGNPWTRTGGTSLAAPLSAGLFADTLVERGVTTGIGSIHAVLYNNPIYAGPGRTFRDITSGDNSFGFEPSHAATVGFDLSSGLGSPVWSNIAARFNSQPQIFVDPAVKTPTVALTINVRMGTTFDQWRVIALNESESPGTSLDCATGTFTTTQPTSVMLPAGDGVKIIYVLAKNASGCVTASTSTLLDTVAPTVTLSAGLTSPTSTTVTVSWSGADPSGSGVDHYAVRITHSGSTAADFDSTTTKTTSFSAPGVPGRTYTVTATAIDLAGNVSAPVTTVFDMPFDDTRFAFSDHWRRYASGGDYGGSVNSSAFRSATAKAILTFRSASALFVFASNAGRVDVFVDNRLMRTIDTYSSSTRYRVSVPFASFSTPGRHTVVFRVRGDKSGASRGATVYLDGVVLTT